MALAVFVASAFVAGAAVGALGGRIGADRELREENKALRSRHDMWNRSAQATDLDEVGPPTPATAQPAARPVPFQDFERPESIPGPTP
jgi:hypothetical protein